MSASDTAARIERLLTEQLEPEHLSIRDDSARHRGHPGATSGGGHYHVEIVSRRFAGKPALERHRMVYAALGELVGREIHALGLKTLAPEDETA